MLLITYRDLLVDAEAFVAGPGRSLSVLLNPDGALEKTEAGLGVKEASITDAMLAGSISFTKLTDYSKIARLDQSESVLAVWNFGSNIPTVSTSPTTANQVTRKAYVDSAIEGLRINVAATVVADTNQALTGLPELDDYQVVAGDIVFCKGQTNAIQNGLYTVDGDGNWVRSPTLVATSVAAGVRVWVNEGTVYAGTCWICDNTVAASVVGTHPLSFTQYPVLNQLIAGDGIVKDGNEIAVNPGNGIQISANKVTLALDGTSLVVGTNGLKANTNSISHVHISNTSFGNGITGGNSNKIALSTLSAAWSLGGAFTITNVPEPVNDSDVATKQYVDANTGAGTSNVRVWVHLLTAGEVSAKQVTLPTIPTDATNVAAILHGAPGLAIGADFAVASDILSWGGLGLDGAVSAGQTLTVIYG